MDNQKRLGPGDREPLEEPEGSLIDLGEHLRHAESDLWRSQDKATLCYHDLGLESDLRETLKEMLDC